FWIDLQGAGELNAGIDLRLLVRVLVFVFSERNDLRHWIGDIELVLGIGAESLNLHFLADLLDALQDLRVRRFDVGERLESLRRLPIPAAHAIEAEIGVAVIS